MYVNINTILRDKAKTLRWLSTEVECNYSNLWKLANNKTNAIRFDLLEKICVTLECRPCDVLVLESETK